MLRPIPCKTFLCGEYAVLAGGPALGLATRPGFDVSTNMVSYHPESAAGLYLKKVRASQSQSQFQARAQADEFAVPHRSSGAELEFFELKTQAPGGFGKSTAEFLAAFRNFEPSATWQQALQTYQNLYDTKELRAQKPSGGDLITQALGRVAVIEADRGKSFSEPWPFQDLGFVLLSTGLKVQTHAHLQNLDREGLKELVPLSEAVVKTFKMKDSKAFFAAIESWRQALSDYHLIDERVHELRLKLQSGLAERLQVEHKKDDKLNDDPSKESFLGEPGFIVKPCGALGADVVLILFKKRPEFDFSSCVSDIAHHFGLQMMASDLDLMPGFWES